MFVKIMEYITWRFHSGTGSIMGHDTSLSSVVCNFLSSMQVGLYDLTSFILFVNMTKTLIKIILELFYE